MSHRWRSPKEFIESSTTVNENGCWLWRDREDNNSYPCLSQRSYWGRIYDTYRVHQLSYMVYKGNYDSSLFVCHKCNIKRCVNPEHLYIADCKQNIQDAVKDGLIGMGKLKVLKVVQLHDEGWHYTDIALKLGLSEGQVKSVLNGHSYWVFIDLPKGYHSSWRAISFDDANTIRKLYAGDKKMNSMPKLAKRYNVDLSYISFNYFK